jgi:hypothetical protein
MTTGPGQQLLHQPRYGDADEGFDNPIWTPEAPSATPAKLKGGNGGAGPVTPPRLSHRIARAGAFFVQMPLQKSRS